MAVKKFRPTTPSRRQMTMATFEEITTNSPEKSLLVSLKKTGGRNAQGKITVRHHGGGAKRKYRIIDILGGNQVEKFKKVIFINFRNLYFIYQHSECFCRRYKWRRNFKRWNKNNFCFL